MLKYILNSAFFYGAWIAIVLEASKGHGYLAFFGMVLFVLIYLTFQRNWREEGFYIFLLAFIGTGLDSLWAANQVIHFNFGYSCPSIAPIWITALWILFAYCVGTSLNWLQGKFYLQIIFGAIGGPLSYFSAFKLGGGAPAITPLYTALLLGIVWAFFFPFALFLRRVIVTDQ